MDPRDDDSDDDGIDDGDENAGKVTSFDGTTLTIALFAGGEVSGVVTDDTEIDCEGDDDDHATTSRDGDDEGDDDHGDDDHSGPGHDGDEGDDDQGDDEGEDCGPDSLTAGAIVHEAELDLTSQGAVFEEVELR
jgi:hypothetical protein